MLLPDCTLFPHGGLPLYIFEPRYRRMLEEAIEGNCFFAVTRLLGDESTRPADCSAAVGTIGLVRASREKEDGTSHLLLHGVMRVRFLQWYSDEPYPSATIEPLVSRFQPEHQAQAAMLTLRGAVEDAIGSLPPLVRDGILGLIDRADTPGLMTDIVSQQFVHDPDLRQRLLEIDAVEDRIPLICDYLRDAGTGSD
jgi:ATP-dependent Lon protease